MFLERIDDIILTILQSDIANCYESKVCLNKAVESYQTWIFAT